MQTLSDITVLDFTTLLPGPLATLILKDAGAEIIKIEKPGGEDLRYFKPTIGDEGVLFAMLNRGKKSIEIDLKDSNAVNELIPLIEKSDVLIEQFRPGVMKRLGLGWSDVKKINPKIVYCSITGYGQTGAKKDLAGHDLNYIAESGLLSLCTDGRGRPSIPITQIADIGGGSYPAVINILLALHKSKATGKGNYIDVSMFDNLMPFAWLGLSQGITSGSFPEGNDLNLNGSSPRYNIYETKNSGFLILGALEDKFWNNFCHMIKADNLIKSEKDGSLNTKNRVQKIIFSHTTNYWKKKIAKHPNTCCSIMYNLAEVMKQKQVRERYLFKDTIKVKNKELPAIPTVIDKSLKSNFYKARAPKLGEHNKLLRKEKK